MTARCTAQAFQSDVNGQKLTGSLGITLSTPIRADYDEKTIIGALVGVIDWPRVQADLGSVEIWGARAGFPITA